MTTKIGKMTLRLVTGHLAKQDTNAVVTAAHLRLNKGTYGTIYTKYGRVRRGRLASRWDHKTPLHLPPSGALWTLNGGRCRNKIEPRSAI